MQQRNSAPVAAVAEDGASDLIANNAVDKAAEAKFDPISDFKMPWWGWAMAAIAAAGLLVYLVD
jgi:hypothetical protein